MMIKFLYANFSLQILMIRNVILRAIFLQLFLQILNAFKSITYISFIVQMLIFIKPDFRQNIFFKNTVE